MQYSAEGIPEDRDLTARNRPAHLEPGRQMETLPPWTRCLTRSPSCSCWSRAGLTGTAGGHRLRARGKPDPPRRPRSPTAAPHHDQRRRLAVKGLVLGRRRLADVAGIVNPTQSCGGSRLVAQKYDGSHARRPGRPSTKPDIAALVVRMRAGESDVGDPRQNSSELILAPAPARIETCSSC